MAIIKTDMWIIRDKITNTLMNGAKGQMAFDSKGHARKSLVHTGWWRHYKMYDTVRKLMPNGNQTVDEYEHLNDLYDKMDWRNRDQRLVDARNDVNSEIKKWMRSSKEYSDTVNKIKFDNQTRYAVESLISIETKEI